LINLKKAKRLKPRGGPSLFVSDILGVLVEKDFYRPNTHIVIEKLKLFIFPLCSFVVIIILIYKYIMS